MPVICTGLVFLIMEVILDDMNCKSDLYPFTLTRSAADIRLGILTTREKWELLTGNKIQTLSELPGCAYKGKSHVIPATQVPSEKWYKKWKNEKKITTASNTPLTIRFPFHIHQYNDVTLKEDFNLVTKKRKSKKISRTNKITGDNIFLEEGAVVEHAVLNAEAGPIYIGKNAVVMEGCIIRGPFAMCEGSILKMGTRIYGATTLGPYCMGGGEIKNSVMFGYSNKSHDGYLGDSVIGEWCNLGAGTSNSNIKNTAGEVKVWNNDSKEFLPAGLKCGLLMGDYSRCAINTSFNTGTVVGVAANIFGAGFPSTFIESFSWGNETYDLEKALEHIDNWKKLKGHILSEQERKILSDIYHQKK